MAADIGRLYDFLAGDVIRSAEVDAEFSQLVARSNVHNAAIGQATASNNSVYKSLLSVSKAMRGPDGYVAGTYVLGGITPSLDPDPFEVVGSTQHLAFPGVYLDDADYAVAGLTAKLRVRAQVSTNGTVPALTFTVGLYPLTFTGGSGNLAATLGTVVAGSTVAIASPSASATTSGVSTAVNIPADGLYCLAVATSATLTTNTAVLVTAQLQTRNV